MGVFLMGYELPPVVSLHKYFIWANKMRTEFDKILPQCQQDMDWHDKEAIEMNLSMSYWYGTLYVVIEGWKELKLSDPKIDALLDSPNVELLRRYRNGVFH
jgi:hypothetical protein